MPDNQRPEAPSDQSSDGVYGYGREIMQYLLRNEKKYLCDGARSQAEVQSEAPTRRIIVQWMIRVHEKFELSCNTIFLAVNVLDRMLKSQGFSRREYHILAAASLFVASKY